jgi:excisionase family DNA binding protein
MRSSSPPRRRATDPAAPARSSGRAPRPERARLAVSTGTAARYCLVNATTIAKWIAAGHLRAQRTRGGRYRIRIDDLRAFMAVHGMRTDILDQDQGLVPTCWEFWASIDRTGAGRGECPTCASCPVFQSAAAVCHAVRPFLPGATLRAPSCPDCIYFATVRGIECHEL